MKPKGKPVSKDVFLKYLLSAAKIEFTKALFLKDKPLPDYPVYYSGYLGRIMIPLEGSMNMAGVYDEKIESRQIIPGNVIYTAKNCWLHVKDFPGQIKSLSVVIHTDYIRYVIGGYQDNKLVLCEYYHTNHPPSDIILALVHALNMLRYKVSDETQYKACLLLRAFLLETLDELKHDHPEKMGKAEHSFKLIKGYIDHNYHLPIDLNGICHELGYNPSYVSRMFKQYGKENIKSYIKTCRMNAATEMLTNIRVKIAQVATQCGYSSEAYFIKVFKKSYGLTPGKFRDRKL